MVDNVNHITLEYFLANEVTGAFKVVNATGFAGPLSFIRITSTFDEPVIISFDGVYGHEYLDDEGQIDLNIQLCHCPNNGVSLFRKFSKVYVKAVGNIPKGGVLYISGFYQ